MTYDDDQLLNALQRALEPTAIVPDEELRRQLLASLELTPVETLGPRLRRRVAKHASALTIAASSVVVLGGVAAAAVATNTLPGPTRAIAYDLGLPVTSPALFQARSDLSQLQHALKAKDHSATSRLGHQLVGDLKVLSHHDLTSIRANATNALTDAGLLNVARSVLGTTTTTPAAPTTTSTIQPASPTTTTTLIPSLPVIGSITPGSTSTGSTTSSSTTTTTVPSSGLSGVLNQTSTTIQSILP